MYTSEAPRKHALHGILVSYFSVTFCDLALAFLSMTFTLIQYLSETYTSTLGKFRLIATRITDLIAHNVKTL